MRPFLIFLFGRHSSADMALLLVYFEYLLHCGVQRRTYNGQLLRQILMYRGLAYAELLCGGADGGPMLDYIFP